MARFCTKCGAAVSEDSRFCGKCGAKVRSDNSDDTAATHVIEKTTQETTSTKKAVPIKIIVIVACVVIAIVGLIWAFASKGSDDSPASNTGSNQSVNAGNNQSSEKSDTFNISEFSEDVSGIWVLVEESNSLASVSFLTITDNLEMTGGVYPGAYGRTCELTEIHKNSNGSFSIVLHYPATEATDMDDAMPELKEAVIFDSTDSFYETLEITYDDGTVREYMFVADEFEQAITKFDQIINEKQKNALEANIPAISASSQILDADFEALKIRMGYDLSGPNDSWRSNSESIFYLTNISDVDCYMNISSKDELLGVKNGEIVFFGIYGLTSSSARVMDLLPNDALTTEPAVYTIRANTASKAGLDSYVWKLNNGYMAAVVVPMGNMNFYDQLVYNVVYVTDLSYLSYLN